MSEPVITAVGLSKKYRLGVLGRKSLEDEVRYWWHRFRGRDPLTHMGTAGGNIPPEGVKAPPSGTASRERDGYFWALQDVSFELNKGEILGVIGRNGAGKSTLLKVLSRITEPSSGEAFVEGRVASLLEVGTGFHPELTGRENVFLNGCMLGMRREEIARKFDEIVDFAEIEAFIDTPVKRYSSGMYVRLAFAVAAHLEPEILLVDEVLAVGDLAFQKKCLGKMQDGTETGRTIIFVSHNMPAVARLCSKAILIDDGAVVYSGGAEDVVAKYTTLSLGAAPVARWLPADAPGTHGFKLLGVSVTDDEGESPSTVDIRKPFWLNIEYHIATPGTRFRFRADFFSRGTLAFPALERTEEVREHEGLYRSRVQIPGNLLAEGEYLIGITALTSRGGKRMPYCKVQDVAVIQVVDFLEGDSARGDFAERLDGVVRPFSTWETVFHGNRHTS